MTNQNTTKAKVIQYDSSINGRPISAWYVRTNQGLFGQYQTEQAAIQSACDKLTAGMITLGEPLDAQAIHDRISFQIV